MAKNPVNSLLDLSAQVIPFSLYPRLVRRDRFDVFYHVVSDEDLPYIQHLYPVIPTERFRQSLDTLGTQYEFVTYRQVHEHILEGRPLPAGALHLSVDDGYRQCFEVIRPILLERKIPATFFLTTGLIDNEILFYRNKVSLAIEEINRLTTEARFKAWEAINHAGDVSLTSATQFRDWIKELRLPDESTIDAVLQILGIDVPGYLQEYRPYLTREQIRTMHAEGFTIGAHTITHRKLGTLASVEARREIIDSCRAVREITGQEVVPLSFPHSGANLSRRLLREIREEHPWIGLFFDTKGLQTDIPIVVNRIWGERSIQPGGEPAPIGDVILNAYQEEWPATVKAALGRGKSIP